VRNSSTGALSIQCDISAKRTMVDYPGYGCANPATGVPPVAPTLLATFTIASGTPTQLTSSAPMFTSADTGTTFTIPGAGPSVAYSGFGTIAEPLVTTVTFVDSTTLTLTTPASNFFSRTQVVERGSPLIPTAYSDTDTADAELLEVTINGDRVTAYWKTQYQSLFNGPMMHYGELFQPQVTVPVNTFPPLTVAQDFSGTPLFSTAEPTLNQRSYVDTEVDGGFGEIATQLLTGGDGNNHPAAAFALKTIQATIQAQDWRMPAHAGVQAVTSGATATVAGCQVGTVNVSDTTAPTITLPATCPVNTRIVFNDAGGDGATATITIAAPAGLTLTGNKTITTAFGARAVTYTGKVAAVAQ
jgi:hypothetical protein